MGRESVRAVSERLISLLGGLKRVKLAGRNTNPEPPDPVLWPEWDDVRKFGWDAMGGETTVANERIGVVVCVTE